MYQNLLDEAMLGIVKKVLSRVQFEGLEKDQSFYISFNTDHPDVILSKNVKNQYPKEITIVLQYQYRDLQVFDDKFKVSIAFGGISEMIHVPFDAIIGFVDPGANFSLQFKRLEEDSNDDLEDEIEIENDLAAEVLETKDILNKRLIKDFGLHKANSTQKTSVENTEAIKKKSGKIIEIDQFRKKKK